MIAKFNYIGRDFTKVTKDFELSSCEINNYEHYNDNKNELKLIKLYFLKFFINYMKDNFINYVVDNNFNNRNCNFIDIINNNYYLNGFVGILTRKFTLTEDDLSISIIRKEIRTLIQYDDEYKLLLEDSEFENLELKDILKYIFGFTLKDWNSERKVDVIISLKIYSRFDIDENENIKSPFFLKTLIANTSLKKLPELELNTFNVNDDSNNLLDFLLIFVFIKQLNSSYIKGFYRTYQTFYKNDTHLRGSIDFPRHIKENIGLNNGCIAYKYREKTTDNYLNHLILTTYNYLKNKYYYLISNLEAKNPEFTKIINDLKYLTSYPKYNIKTLITKNSNILSHPYYTEYENLRITCLRILRNEGISLFDENIEDDGISILFYIPDLWEDFVLKYLNRYRGNYIVDSQVIIRIFDYNESKDFIQETRPDYVFYDPENSNKPFMILDAKFKQKWGNIINKKQKISDVLEDYDKCIRDMNTINSHASGVIYPTNISDTDYNNYPYIHNISRYNQNNHFYTFPVKIPYITVDYDNWVDELEKSCESIFKIISQKIDNELKGL